MASTACSAPVSGDNYLVSNGTCVLTWSNAVNPSTSFFPGYSSFQGFTQGPGYWGKTFFIWPPQPGNDWRKLYFELTSRAPLNDNTKLWNSSGVWQNPSGNYIINYAAILNWIRNVGPNPFPSQLRAGNVLYYGSIPDDVPVAAYDPTQPNGNINGSDGGTTDQRFWKEYIDYVIGVWRDPNGNVQNPGTPSCSYGSDFTPGTTSAGSGIQITGPDYPYKSGYAAFIDPNDNPKRPRHRLWFGPMTMIQFMSDTGLLPGTTHDISMVVAKLGIAGALQDIQNNHPNDLVSLIMFSRPPFNGEVAACGQFPYARNNLSGSYASMINTLWFPPNSYSADVRPWDSNDQQTPRAHGDYDSNTTTDYGLMLAYNQFGCNTTLQTTTANGQSVAMGGFGRVGAQKIVILETDGMVNQATAATFVSQGSYNSYYNLPPLGTVSASGSPADTSTLAVAQRICAEQRQRQRPRLCHGAEGGADLLHRLRRDLRAHGGGRRAGQCRGVSSEPGRDRRHHVSWLCERPSVRLLVVHWDPCPAGGQVAAGIRHHHGPDRVHYPGALISARRRREALRVESRGDRCS